MSETAERTEMALAQGNTFVWHEVYGPSAETSVDFYTKALGFGSQEMPMGEMGTYTMLTRNGQPVAGVLGTANDPRLSDVPPHWSVYIGVDDVDARLEKCLASGAKVIHGPMDVPTIGRMALIQDPQGAMVWIFKGEPSQ
jgi:predicted enzyme related to lactoylglutathione lyase